MSQTSPQTTTLAALKPQHNMTAPAEMRAGFDTVGGFELMQRGAKLLASSTIVPASYRSMVEKKVGGNVQLVENPSAMSNCVVALNMAQRMGADPLMIMQNLYIVEGRPAWSSQYIIASINACGKYSPLRFTIEELGEKEAEYTHIKWEGQYPNRRRTETQVKTRIQDKRCIAWAIEKATGERLESPPVTVELAVKEGWYGKEGSKWQTMPEVMLRYRAASFFGKLYAPELLMGIQTAEEAHDTTYTCETDEAGVYQMTTADIRKPDVAFAADTAGQSKAGSMPVEFDEEFTGAPDETTVPPSDDEVEKQARNKERAAQIAALSTLREETKVAWLATGAPVEEAETLVNAFAPKWNTAQCQRIMAEVQKRQASPVPSETESTNSGAPTPVPPAPGIECPNRGGAIIDDWECARCRDREGCPSWANE